MSVCIKCGRDVMPGVIICNDCVLAMFGSGKEGNTSLPAGTEVLWVCTCQNVPVGIVKRKDEITGKTVFYIGVGLGCMTPHDVDVQHILDWGQKYEDVSFIRQFLEVDD